MQLNHELLALRDGVAFARRPLSEWQGRLDRAKARGRQQVEDREKKLKDALAREDELKTQLRAAEDERDAWRTRSKDAEAQAELDRTWAVTAEGGKAYAEAREQIAKELADSTERRLDLEEHRSAELQKEKEAALERIGAMELVVTNAEGERDRARSMERAALDRVEEMTREAEQLEKWAREVEVQARKRACIAESRARDAVAAFRESPEFVQEVTEGSLDAYAQGFAECKVRVARTFRINPSELDEIRPGDADE